MTLQIWKKKEKIKLSNIDIKAIYINHKLYVWVYKGLTIKKILSIINNLICCNIRQY